MASLLLIVDESNLQSIKQFQFTDDFQHTKIEVLQSENVDVVLCSGILPEMKQQLESLGIQVADGFRGNPINQLNYFLRHSTDHQSEWNDCQNKNIRKQKGRRRRHENSNNLSEK
jgi:predicted Fe-Mo cluster-binding NifX family protein